MTEHSKKRQREPRERGVFERPPGSGVWWVRYADENGGVHREKVGPKALALKVYRKRKTQVAERRFFPEQIRWHDVLLSKVIDDYLKRSENTLRSYRDYERYGRYWKEALGNKTLRQVLPSDIERYIANRIEDLKPASINRQLAFLKRVFNVAIADGKATTNPVRAVKLFKENNQRVRFLADEEEARLRAAIGEAEWPMVDVAMHTGLRQGEQFKLKWKQVDFTTGVITIPRSKHGETRHVTMNDTVREILRAQPGRLKSDYVFPSDTGKTPLDACNYMRRVFVPALEAAKIENFHWHDLRHTFASRLVMKGVDLRTVQELMGHKTITMTLRYSHLSPAHQLDAVQRLNRPPTGTSSAPVETGKVLWMKEPHDEGVANRIGPESCVAVREDRGEALTGVRAGQPLSREKEVLAPGADAVTGSGRPHRPRRYRKTGANLARSKTLRMHGNTLHGNREIPPPSGSRQGPDRIGESRDQSR